MAIPTFASVSPATGLTKGRNIVEITGTNFALPTSPPATGYVGGDAPLSVKVSFEGVECEWAEAASSTQIFCTVPQWAGDYDVMPLDLDIRIANLNPDGSEVAGENVTALDAYQVTRPNLAEESTFQKICREVVSIFRRHLLENTHITMSRSNVESTAGLERVKAEAPVCYLIGPRTTVNRLCSLNKEDPEEDLPVADQ